MRILAKVGGTLLDAVESRKNISVQLAALAAQHELVVVHGGGKQLTRYLDERGITSKFVRGLRVSDDKVIDAATKVIAGTVNKQFAAALLAEGASAIGLSGVDGALTRVIQTSAELQFVGSPVESNGALLRLLAEAGYLPVVACLGADRNGAIYNVNADQMAVSCAVAFNAQKLVFLTDVPGVKDSQGEVMPELQPADVAELILSGVAHGGMHAKLDATLMALRGGIREVAIVSGHEPGVCARVLQGEGLGGAIGTRVSLDRSHGATL